MKCQFTTVIDTDEGSYEVEFTNLAEPGGGLDYDLLMRALRRVLDDFESRMENTRASVDADMIEVYGDDPLN